MKLTDAEWRDFQSIPEQGYSHRHWIDYHIAKRVTEALEEAGRIARTYLEHDGFDMTTEAIIEALADRADDYRKGGN